MERQSVAAKVAVCQGETATVRCIGCQEPMEEVVCTGCGTRQPAPSPVAKVAVERAGQVNVAKHVVQVTEEAGCTQDAMLPEHRQDINREPATMAVRSEQGGVYTKAVKNLILTQQYTNIKVDTTQRCVRVKVATDLEELQSAADDVLIMETDWSLDRNSSLDTPVTGLDPQVTDLDPAVTGLDPGGVADHDPEVTPSGVPTASHPSNPSSSSSGLQAFQQASPPAADGVQEESRREGLATRLIDSETENLYAAVLQQVSGNTDLPSSIVQRLYTRFHLRLLGITKRLEFLMDVDSRDKASVLKLQPQVQDVLAEVVPKSRRSQLTWQKFVGPSVQCLEDLEACASTAASQSDVHSTTTAIPQPGAHMTTSATSHPGGDLPERMQRVASPDNTLQVGHQMGAEDTFESSLPSAQQSLVEGHLDLATVLKAGGANINDVDDNGWTVLHHAASFNSPMLVQSLLAWGVDPKVKAKDDKTAVHVAAQFGFPNSVTYLLDAGVPVDAKELEKGRTALHYACGNGHAIVVEVLLKRGASVDVRDKDGRTAFHHACNGGDLDVATVLKAGGANINDVDDNGWTGLHHAARNDTPMLVQSLLAWGVDPKVKANDDKTAVHVAAQFGFPNSVTYLLDAGVPVDAEELKMGRTALHYACIYGHAIVVEVLLKRGASVDVRDKDGWTAFHHACNRGHLGVVKLLVENRAQIKAGTHMGWTALHLACFKGHLDVAAVLKAGGAHINDVDDNGWTGLHHAANNGIPRFVRPLLAWGADPKIKAKDGSTPANVAKQKGHMDFVVEINQLTEGR